MGGADPRRAAASGRAHRARDDADERSAGRSRRSRTCRARDASIDSPLALRALPERWVVVGWNEDGVEVLRKWFDRPVAAGPAGVGGDHRRTGAGDRGGRRQLPRMDRRLRPGARGRHGRDGDARRRLRRHAARRVQPPRRRRRSARRRPRRAHVAARRPRRHRRPRLPAPGDADQQPRRHVHAARRTWPTRRSRRQTSIASGRPASQLAEALGLPLDVVRGGRRRRAHGRPGRIGGRHRDVAGDARLLRRPAAAPLVDDATLDRGPRPRPQLPPAARAARRRCASAASRSACCP